MLADEHGDVKLDVVHEFFANKLSSEENVSKVREACGIC